MLQAFFARRREIAIPGSGISHGSRPIETRILEPNPQSYTRGPEPLAETIPPGMEPKHLSRDSLRRRLYHVIFEADTFWGKTFDVALIVAILISVAAVMLDSVEPYRVRHGQALWTIEWVLTIFFTIEYLLRLTCVSEPRKYALSFFGLIDLLAILPTFIALFIPGAQYLLVVRVLRILRVFRVLKLAQYVQESNVLTRALWASRRKIIVFLFAVFTIVVVIGSIMYLIEGQSNQTFSSIPQAVYWAVVTLTTVGYGDITPQTEVGKTVATFVMIMGYGIIAVPTGIVTGEIITQTKGEPRPAAQACRQCQSRRNPEGAQYCCDCGTRL